jgi:tetratricopeptide (TPR) repeat protein
MPISIDDAMIEVRSLATSGDYDGVMALVAAVEASPVETIADMRHVVAFMFEAKNRGVAELVVERFANAAPADFDVQLLRVETLIKLGRLPLAAGLMDNLQPQTCVDFMRAGATWQQLRNQSKAAAAYRAASDLAPDDLNCRRGLIEAYSWGGQPSLARQTLVELEARLPDQIHWWAFAADKASALGDKKLFSRAAKRAEALPGRMDENSRLLLVRAYGRCGQRRDAARHLAALNIGPVLSDNLLKMALELAKEHGLSYIELTAATEIVRRGTASPAFIEQCRALVDSHRPLAERLFAR